jgi:predicted KAP-like P-loop ATPase
MRIKPLPLELPEENPFQNDKLSRSQPVEAISQIISSLDESLVLAVTSPWGTGKTTFLLLLESKLRQLDVPTLYVNAWENDFFDNAFLSLDLTPMFVPPL